MECPRRHRAAKARETDGDALPVDFHGAGAHGSEVFRLGKVAADRDSASSERRRAARGTSGGCGGSGGESWSDINVEDVATQHSCSYEQDRVPRLTCELRLKLQLWMKQIGLRFFSLWRLCRNLRSLIDVMLSKAKHLEFSGAYKGEILRLRRRMTCDTVRGRKKIVRGRHSMPVRP